MKYSIYCILIFISISLTSCFEIIEDVAVHTNGSGTYKFIVNLSQSKNQIDKIRTQDSILHFHVPKTSDIDAKLTEVKNKLSGMTGISNVLIRQDHVNYMYQITFDFKQVNELNNAIYTIWKTYDKNAPASFNLYAFENNVFKRNANSSHVDHLIKSAGSQEIEMCQKSSYTIIYRFDTPVISSSSMNYSLSPSKKGALYKSDVWSTMADKTKSNNTLVITP